MEKGLYGSAARCDDSNDFAAELGDLVTVGLGDLFDDPVSAQHLFTCNVKAPQESPTHYPFGLRAKPALGIRVSVVGSSLSCR